MKKPGLPTSKSPAWSNDATAIDRDAPLRLAQAAEIAFPGGGMTAPGCVARRDGAA
jgi:hypothetical protein